MSYSKFHAPPPRLLAIACLCAALLFGVAGSAHAGTLLPGTAIANDGLGAATGSILATTSGAYSFVSGTTTFAGSYREVVISGGANSIGGVTFLLQIQVTSGDLRHVTLANVTGWSTSASALTLGATDAYGFVATTTKGGLVGATPISRLVDPLGVVNFDFDSTGAFGAGENSVEMIIHTNAPTFAVGTIGLQDGGGTTVAGFAPAPEPASMTLLGIGLAGMGGYAWRRRRQQQPTPTVS